MTISNSCIPEQFTLIIDVSKVAAKTLLSRDSGDVQHPGGRADALLELGDALNALKIPDQICRALACGTVVDDLASALQQEKLIKGLHQEKDPNQLAMPLTCEDRQILLAQSLSGGLCTGGLCHGASPKVPENLRKSHAIRVSMHADCLVCRSSSHIVWLLQFAI